MLGASFQNRKVFISFLNSISFINLFFIIDKYYINYPNIAKYYCVKLKKSQYINHKILKSCS